MLTNFTDISQSDQMHFQKLWSIWNNSDYRRHVCTPSEHYKRESVHLSLVLVHHSGDFNRNRDFVATGKHYFAQSSIFSPPGTSRQRTYGCNSTKHGFQTLSRNVAKCCYFITIVVHNSFFSPSDWRLVLADAHKPKYTAMAISRRN